ncbi:MULTISPECIES: Panacea domain-containing protein [Nosocomiicoccus]|uniref:DUF4065 domain-containing protein n=1 Tax=Nosocomiicoccus massiliensis TaxID=1232430 RepID=A0AAF1BVS7_9STAP|nr:MULTISPECIES: type II toxin-antitoxin system antitoxin SocA domain-containing protein [Nosocomiicoccus]MDK6863186.1 DUF4065 domain-containing protein [Nosocomiicoccus ampullae]WOS96681.1 DUF4065 domain-containing protein [Nosocomiicoccus massiliensis]
MSKLNDFANYMIESHRNITSSQLNSELKLQKLLYFAQRESLAYTGDVLFDNEFEGWEHGPVLKDIRYYFDENYSISNQESTLTETEKFIIDSVVHKYAKYDAWYLRNLSHEEYSWIKSREGLKPHESGNKVLAVSDIKKDAEKVKVFDSLYGVYIDEHEDAKGYSFGL